MSVFIIAEFGMLHDGSLGNAKKMAEAAKDCGADAVKFQTHIAQAETIRNAPAPPFFTGEPRWEYFQRTAFTLDQWRELKAHCEKIGILFLSSPFSLEAAQLLEDIGMKRFKIPSGENTNIPYLEYIASTGKPVILSSGMSDWTELDDAVEIFQRSASLLTILQCTSMYPTPPERVGLNVMLEMKERYHAPVGLSDQSLMTAAVVAAVALGATVIEKHVTLSRKCYGSDAHHSVELAEFARCVSDIRAVETILNNPVDKNDLAPYREMKRIFEKSIVTVNSVPAGTQLEASMLAIKKPGDGIPPRRWNEVLGRIVKRDLAADTLLRDGDLG